MPFHGEIFKLGAERTGVGATIGDVEIETVADGVSDTAALVSITDTEQAVAVQ